MPLPSYAETPDSQGAPDRINEASRRIQEYWDEPLTVLAIALGADASVRALVDTCRQQLEAFNQDYGDLHRLLWIQRPEDARDTPIANLLQEQTAFLLVTRGRGLSTRWSAADIDLSPADLYVASMDALHHARAGQTIADGAQGDE